MDFSQLVDDIAKDLGKPFDTERFARLTNMAIRYVEDTTKPSYLHCEEEHCLNNKGSGLVWSIKDVKRYMCIVYAEDMDGTPAKCVKPSEAMARVRKSGLPYYYESGASVVFGNLCRGARFTVQFHSPWFKYYKKDSRPAQCIEGEWNCSMDQETYEKVTSLTLEIDHALVYQRVVQMYQNQRDDPASDNADREYQRVWNASTT